MKKRALWKQLWFILAGWIMIVSVVGMEGVCAAPKKKAPEENATASRSVRQSPKFRVASDDSVSCLNVWSSDGSAGTQPMTVYYGSQDSGIATPQIIYIHDSLATSVFCTQYGSALSSGNKIELLDEGSYEALNEEQKRAISLVLGYATWNHAPRDGQQGYVSLNTGDCTFENFQWYVSTQLMIWYYIDLYSGRAGTGNTGGITWDGLQRTCDAGWANYGECVRIWSEIENTKVLPSFCSDSMEEAQVLELKYRHDLGIYETVVEDEHAILDQFAWTELSGLECVRCNPDGSENENGSAVRLRSAERIPKELPVILTCQRRIAGSTVYYLSNKTESQDLTFSGGSLDLLVDGYLRVITETVPTVELEKRDADSKKPIAGVHLQILEGNRVLEDWTTTSAGYQTKKLQGGHTYTLHEVSPADGYVKGTDLTFTVEDRAEVQTITLYNKKTQVEIWKVDADTQKAVSGASLELYDGKTCIDSWISENVPHVVRGLKTGHTYTVRETKAPSGYTVSGETTFTVDMQETVQRIVIENEKETVTTTEEATTTTETPVTTTEASETVTTETEETPSTTEAQFFYGEASTDTIVAGSRTQKEKPTPTPVTGDMGIPEFAYAGIVLGGILFGILTRKKR